MKWSIRALLLSAVLLLSVVLPCATAFADSPEIISAKVFDTYEEDDDWLVVIAYNISPENNPPEDRWLIQLRDETNTSIAQAPMRQWGMKPGSIYLAEDMASAYEWGNEQYNVFMYDIADPAINASHNLSAIDWIGYAPQRLDSWCLTFAQQMDDYDSPTTPYITETVEYGPMLSLQCGVWFDIGIPDLSNVHPNLFEAHIEEFAYWEDTTWTNSYASTLDDWETTVGPELTNAFNDAGDLIDIDGRYIGGMFVFIGFIALAALSVAMGHISAGATLASLAIFGGVILGLIPIAIVFVAIVLLTVMFVKNYWFGGT